MQSSGSRRFPVVRRGVAAATLAAMVCRRLGAGAAGAADRTQAEEKPPVGTASGVVEAGAARTPPTPSG